MFGEGVPSDGDCQLYLFEMLHSTKLDIHVHADEELNQNELKYQFE